MKFPIEARQQPDVGLTIASAISGTAAMTQGVRPWVRFVTGMGIGSTRL